jgi:hypothetical protein
MVERPRLGGGGSRWRGCKCGLPPIAAGGQLGTLCPRELQVLKLIAEAYTSKEIAQELVISIKTVERHRQNILDDGVAGVAPHSRWGARRIPPRPSSGNAGRKPIRRCRGT